jgi:hypothetical protein
MAPKDEGIKILYGLIIFFAGLGNFAFWERSGGGVHRGDKKDFICLLSDWCVLLLSSTMLITLHHHLLLTDPKNVNLHSLYF